MSDSIDMRLEARRKFELTLTSGETFKVVIKGSKAHSFDENQWKAIAAKTHGIGVGIIQGKKFNPQQLDVFEYRLNSKHQPQPAPAPEFSLIHIDAWEGPTHVVNLDLQNAIKVDAFVRSPASVPSTDRPSVSPASDKPAQNSPIVEDLSDVKSPASPSSTNQPSVSPIVAGLPSDDEENGASDIDELSEEGLSDDELPIDPIQQPSTSLVQPKAPLPQTPPLYNYVEADRLTVPERETVAERETEISCFLQGKKSTEKDFFGEVTEQVRSMKPNGGFFSFFIPRLSDENSIRIQTAKDLNSEKLKRSGTLQDLNEINAFLGTSHTKLDEALQELATAIQKKTEPCDKLYPSILYKAVHSAINSREDIGLIIVQEREDGTYAHINKYPSQPKRAPERTIFFNINPSLMSYEAFELHGPKAKWSASTTPPKGYGPEDSAPIPNRGGGDCALLALIDARNQSEKTYFASPQARDVAYDNECKRLRNKTALYISVHRNEYTDGENFFHLLNDFREIVNKPAWQGSFAEPRWNEDLRNKIFELVNLGTDASQYTPEQREFLVNAYIAYISQPGAWLGTTFFNFIGRTGKKQRIAIVEKRTKGANETNETIKVTRIFPNTDQPLSLKTDLFIYYNDAEGHYESINRNGTHLKIKGTSILMNDLIEASNKANAAPNARKEFIEALNSENSQRFKTSLETLRSEDAEGFLTLRDIAGEENVAEALKGETQVLIDNLKPVLTLDEFNIAIASHSHQPKIILTVNSDSDDDESGLSGLD